MLRRYPCPSESVWELENRPRIGPRPVGPVAKLQPSPEGLGLNSATSSERRRCGTQNVGSAAPPALHNLGDPSPSPPPDFLWNLVALANFMRLSVLKGARAASSSAAWQEIRVPRWAEVWLPALRAWVRFAVHFRVPTQTRT